MASVINRAEAVRRTLSRASERAHKFTRVSKELTDALEIEVDRLIEAWVRSAPSKGKTLYPPLRPKEKIDETGD